MTQFSSIARRLASTCARGVRQQSNVNELLSGKPLQVTVYTVAGEVRVTYGKGQTGYASFKALRRRLTAVGFVLEDLDGSIQMTFPEEEE